jgi:hypothetical protein
VQTGLEESLSRLEQFAGRRLSGEYSAELYMRPRSDIGGTVDQLGADVDRGRTGDKVAGSDFAAAPLGADEEAAGTPVSSQQATAAQLHEASSEHTTEPGWGGTSLALIIFIFLAFAGGLATLLAL